jgi:hypothetical protein
VSVGDLHEKCDRYEQALKKIQSASTDELVDFIASKALEEGGAK